MNKSLIIIVAVLLGMCSSNADTVKNYYSDENFINVSSSVLSPYNQDLSTIELNLFGKKFTSEEVNARISRIEKKLFNQSFDTMTTAQRMNNILVNSPISSANSSYYPPYQGTNAATGILKRVQNAIIGQPTGYTPQIYPSPYLNTYGPSYMQGYYGNNGWRYHNATHPAMTGANIHILQ